ncbi:hypothetical protein T484DRAFT_1904516 [Baffinella frigidus]|nr:hypothetical protein T484DRAFT_1904516 [Cryptophyta sp. CCMP2293]
MTLLSASVTVLAPQAAYSAVWVSDSSVKCRYAKGRGSGHALVVTVVGHTATVTGVFSYDSPSATRASPANLPSSGREVLITGENFAGSSGGASGRARIGGSACLASTWAARGSGTARSEVVTVDAQRGTTPALASYDAASILLLSPYRRIDAQRGTTPALASYDTASIRLLSPNNAPTLPTDPSEGVILVRGSGLGHFDQSHAGRVGGTACAGSEWVSDSALVCRVAPSLSGGLMPIVVSVVGEVSTSTLLFSYNGPVVLDALERSLSLVSASHVTLTGSGFGAHDYTVGASMGPFGCTATSWLSDSAIACKLAAGVLSGDVSLKAIRGCSVCRVCLPQNGETLVGCTNTSAGFCVKCGACPPGEYRDCGSASSSGRCVACPNANLPRDKRTFKSSSGGRDTQCTSCTLCGGLDQNATQFEGARCMPDRDAICSSCPGCAAGVRVGCAGGLMGYCADIGEGVAGVLATASAQLPGEELENGTFRDASVFMEGRFARNGVSVAGDTDISFPTGVQNITVSVISPSEAMIAASNASINAPGGGRTRVSDVVYLSPSGLTKRSRGCRRT